jgi:integrase
LNGSRAFFASAYAAQLRAQRRNASRPQQSRARTDAGASAAERGRLRFLYLWNDVREIQEKPNSPTGHSGVNPRLSPKSRGSQSPSTHAAVSVIVASAIRRAKVKRPARGAAHLLRHSVASSMLRQGASLQEIAALLRHRSVETTQIYAKVDVKALQKIAQPWPGGASC